MPIRTTVLALLAIGVLLLVSSADCRPMKAPTSVPPTPIPAPHLRYFGYFVGEDHLNEIASYTNVVFVTVDISRVSDTIEKIKAAKALDLKVILDPFWKMFASEPLRKCKPEDTVNQQAVTDKRDRYGVRPDAEAGWRDFVRQLRAYSLVDVVVAVFTVDEPDYNCVHQDEVARIAQIVQDPIHGLPDANTLVIYTGDGVDSPDFQPDANHDWVSLDAYGDFDAMRIRKRFTKLKELLSSKQKAVLVADGNLFHTFTWPPPLTEAQQQPFLNRANQYYALAQEDASVVALLVYLWASVQYGSPTGIGGLAAFSDANGWGDPQYYSTLHFANINGDGKADVCARGAGELACFSANPKGLGFPPTASGSVGVRDMPLVRLRWQTIGWEIVRH